MIAVTQEQNPFLNQLRIFQSKLGPNDFSSLSKMIISVPKFRRLYIDECQLEDNMEELCLRHLEISLKRNVNFE